MLRIFQGVYGSTVLSNSTFKAVRVGSSQAGDCKCLDSSVFVRKGKKIPGFPRTGDGFKAPGGSGGAGSVDGVWRRC